MRHEYLMSSKAGKPVKDFLRTNVPTVAPDIKSTGAQISYSMLKVKKSSSLEPKG